MRSRRATSTLPHPCPNLYALAQGHFNWAEEPRKWVLSLARRAGVKMWLCGHYHGNCVVTGESGVEVVTTSSCGGVINWSRGPSEIATNEVFNFMQ